MLLPALRNVCRGHTLRPPPLVLRLLPTQSRVHLHPLQQLPRFASVKAGNPPLERKIPLSKSASTSAASLNVNVASELAKDAFKSIPESSAASSEPSEPAPSPAVGIWLMSSSLLVLVVVVVGGITRLTESGLSITEWKPITGVIPPLSASAWDAEFEKYKATPEFKMLNHGMSVDDFKRIFYMEWGHRILGRVIGLAFVGPLAYFAMRRKLSRSMALRLTGLGTLIGAQGALGWYMVRSGLEDSILETPGAVPRVSHYRLAAHLSMAFALYLGMFASGMAILKDVRFVRTGQASGVSLEAFDKALNNPVVRRFASFSRVLTGLVLLTALSGVFVAGLDAGLIYNEWPAMAGGISPPAEELFSTQYAQNADKTDLWRNFFDNPSLVQFDHRMLATTTYAGTALLYYQTLRPALRAVAPPLILNAARAAFAMANVQLLLGITTLIYMVPVPLAAAHQGGSILLLSAMVHVLLTLRRPGAAARAWRTWRQKTSQVP